ncbi:MAG: c-type cytochrome domain-containing protein [Candidatus Hydrogenedentes bacterium]|nr:c-type cytochrome domain-containing protein [Candidatus Hydrogenedentota bacterium]
MNWHHYVLGCVAVCGFAGCNPQGAGPAAIAASTPAGGAAHMVSFQKDVKPILDVHCSDCHLSGKKKGGYSLDSHVSAIEAGAKGARIVAGSSASSNLIQRVQGADGVKRMPPKGEMLSAADVAIIAGWIDQGASLE